MEKLIQLKKIGSVKLGYLSVIDDIDDIDFPIKRVYYTYGVEEDGLRGNHAHKKLQQVIWCPFGCIEITVDNGNSKTVYLLDTPDKALVIPGKLWLTLQWKQAGSVLCAAVSDYFDEEDYIRDYSQYLKYVGIDCL